MGADEPRCEKVRAKSPSVAVIGSGLVGLVSALALAARGVRVALIGPSIDKATIARDTRSTALFGPSLTLLQRIGALVHLEDRAEPLRALRLVDDTGALFRAPELLFEAHEIGEVAFGLNIENGSLLEALAVEVEKNEQIKWLKASVCAVEPGEETVGLQLANCETLRVSLVVGADGAQSMSRAAAGVVTREWASSQVAIASRFAHQRPHGGVSTELHRRVGPLTTVPLAGGWSSLVWVETAVEAKRLVQLDERSFARELEARLGDLSGAIGAIGPRASFPISGVSAEPMAARRIALVGEAAHRLPPIGAQGLNLGLRDAAWLADLVGDAVAAGHDPGGATLLEAYERARRRDVASRATVVDALNQSLLAGLFPIDIARGAGLAAMKVIGPVRRLFMREGMSPSGPLPTLMQPL